MSKVTQFNWSSTEIESLREELSSEIKALASKEGLSSALEVLQKEIVSEESTPGEMSSFLMSKLVSILVVVDLATKHHALKQTNVEKLLSMAEEILRAAGIIVGRSRLSYLYGEIYLLRSRIALYENPALSCWQTGVAESVSGRPSLEFSGKIALESAPKLLRQGQASECIRRLLQFKEVPEVEFPYEAKLLHVKALRLAGSIEIASDVCHAYIEQEPVHDELKWELLCCEAQRTGSGDQLARTIPKQFDGIENYITAKLWLFCGQSKVAYRQLPKVESIKKKFRKEKGVMEAHSAILAALKSLEEFYDTELALKYRLDSVGQAFSNLAKVNDVEYELMFLFATARMLARHSQFSLRDLLLKEFKQLCLKLSDGHNDNVMGLVFDAKPQKQPSYSKSARLMSIAKVAGKSLANASNMRMRRLMADKSESERLRKMEAAKLGEILFNELGQYKGALMKVGQVLGMASEYDKEFTNPLSHLHFTGRETETDIVRKTIEDSFGDTIENLFASFADEPLGTGSIGQVHKATLKDGRKVVMKVKHPNIRQAMESDMSILNLLKPMLKRLMPLSDVPSVIDEIAHHLLLETDYGNELKNQKLFFNAFKDEPNIVIPTPIEEFCTEEVLTSEFIEGVPYDEFLAESDPIERRAAGNTIFDAFVKSFPRTLSFNADPHPGNYIFMGGPKVAFIDFGCVKHLEQYQYDDLIQFASYLSRGENDKLVPHMKATGYRVADDIDMEALIDDFQVIHAPAVRDDFVFDMKFLERCYQVYLGKGPNQYKIGPPADSTLGFRISFGLANVLVELGASDRWKSRFEEYLKEREKKSDKHSA
jgi:predicted unusual protein kinase regulating ubiquinone biosynthesis (AarF/ABC1/UbiB family)